MAVVKNLMVRAGADFSAITTQAKKASKSMSGMQSSVSRSCNLMTKAASGVKKVLGALGIGLSVAAIAKLGKEAAEAYDTQVQGEMKLATVMRKTMGASNAEIQSIMDLTAAEQQLGVVGDEAQIAGAQQLATYLHLSSSLKTLLPVMNDLAVQQYGFNVSEDQAVSIAKLFGKAMEGQTGALTRYGFSVTDAQARVLKYGSAQERAATLADIVSQKVGGMNAALASTPTGRMQQLKNALGDIKEQFGQAVRTVGTAFLPALNAVGSVLAGIATMANKVAQAIANVFGGTVAGKEWQWSGVSAGISETADAVDDLTDAQYGSAGAAKKQKEALQTASFDTLNILKATDAAGGGGGGGGGTGGSGTGSNPISETETASTEAGDSLGWLQQKLEKLKTGWEDFKSKLDFTRLKAAWGELKEAIGEFGSSVGQILGAVWKKYLEPLAVWTINKALPVALKALAKVIAYVAEKFKDLAALIRGDMSFKEWLATLSPVEKAIGAVVTAIVSVTTAVKVFSTVMTGIKIATTVASAAITALTSPVGWAVLAIAALIAIGIALVENWDTITAATKNFGQRLKECFTEPYKGLQSLVKMFKSIGEYIVDGVTKPFKTAYSILSGLVEKIKNLLNFNWSFPKPKLPHINWSFNYLKLGNFSLPIPKFSVEWYAKGGVFDQASLIGVGEDGKEAVVPLEKNTGWIRKVASELAAQMTGGVGMLNGEALIEGIHDAVYEAMMAVMGMQGRSGSHKTIVNINGREFYRATWDDYEAVSRERGVSLVNK